jgi:glycerol-3-phosphate dehydrogenase
MNRDVLLKNLETPEWDVLVIGGGATGLGTAVDAAARGYKTVLLEQHDFAKASSSRSTKLIHGGLRYLQQGNIHLVKEALHERGLLCENAPHLVHHLPFLVPLYRWWEAPFYGIGLKVYDLLAGKLGLQPSKHLSRKQTLRALPNLHPEGLRGGALYYDGQFDDARLAITLAQTAAELGATVLNYFKVTSFIKKKGKIIGVRARNEETGESYPIFAKVVINAAGIFSDEVRRLDNSRSPSHMVPSQGVHLVLPAEFLDSKTAILVPHTDDGRVIFLVPWNGRVIVGTTDTPLKKPVLEPRALAEEIDFLLKHTARYLTKEPTRADVLSHFTGIRPLVREGKQKPGSKTSAIARDHVITISPAGLVTIAGGKWTTYRKMAEDTIDKAIPVGDLPPRPSCTSHLKLFGYRAGLDPQDPWSTYGSQIKALQKLSRTNPLLKKKLTPDLPYTFAHIQWALDHEMALTVEDVLSRRTRLLLLDARAALAVAPAVAHFMARHLKRSKKWEQAQVQQFSILAKRYV